MPDRDLLSVEPFDPKESEEQPQGYLAVKLSDEDRPKLEAWTKSHLEQIETALQETHGRFEEEINQLEGHMPGGDYPYPGAFRVNVPVTKKKVREIANRLKQAYLDSDPIWAVTSDQADAELVAAVERGLDRQVDHDLDLIDDLSQALFESVLHGVGAIEPCWAYFEDVRRDVEIYRGFDGIDPQSLADLLRFEQRYPDWQDNKLARSLHAKIAKGADQRVEVAYRTATVNRPDGVHIPAKDLRLYPHLNSNVEIQQSPAYGYVKVYTRMELEALAADGTIEDDQLGRVFGDDEEHTGSESARKEMDAYEVAKLTVRYKLAGDDEPVRYQVWYERESGAIIRVRHFWAWLDAPNLILFHTRQEEPGVFKRGIAWDLKDTHVANNVTFSLFLNGADMANSMGWKAKSGSLAEAHIVNRRWSPHLPMPWTNDPNEVESLARSTAHLGPLVQGHELTRRLADEETQTSSLQSGRESPTDPSAPAAKTAMLLAQVEPNMKEHIRSLEPGFRLLGKWILWMYYQGKRMGWIDEVPGMTDIPDEQLVEFAQQLSPRALLFEGDRNSRLQADSMVMGWVSKGAPQALPQVMRKAISHVSSEWAKEVDSLPLEAPPPMPAPGTPPPQPGAGLAPNSNGGGNGRLAEMLA